MARPYKQTVDYFPHFSDASSSKTLYILESKFGNDGYAFWFKLLETLANTEGHVYDVRNPVAWEFLLAKAHVDNDRAEKIMTLLVDLEAIDSELWTKGLIWVQKLVDNIADAYRNRKTEIPLRPSLDGQKPIATEVSDVSNGVSNSDNPHTKLNYTKLKDILTRFETFWSAYPKKKSKGQAERTFRKINPDEQLLAVMLASIERAKKAEDWVRSGGQFVPHPATWLNAKGWEDEIPEGDTHGASIRNTRRVRKPGEFTNPEEL